MTFDSNVLTENLRKQGIAEPLIAVMVRQAEKTVQKASASKEPKPKPKKGRWYPGMPSNSSKIEADVEVSAHCETCGRVEVKTIRMTIKKDSPLTQTVAVSVCKHCPEFFRQFSHETLVSLIMINQHHGLSLERLSTKTQIRLARKMKAEEIVTYQHVR